MALKEFAIEGGHEARSMPSRMSERWPMSQAILSGTFNGLVRVDGTGKIEALPA